MANEPFLGELTLLLLKEGFAFLLIGRPVTQEVIDDDQDSVSDSYRSSFRPSPFGNATILFSQITPLLVRGSMSGLNARGIV